MASDTDSGIRGGVDGESGDTIIVILIFLSISFYKSVAPEPSMPLQRPLFRHV